LGTGEDVHPERRRIRTLPRSARQLLGLRTQLGRHPLALIILDEPWEGLDADAIRWLHATLETKRDRGCAIVLSSRRLADLSGLCDKYLFLTPHAPVLINALDLEPTGCVGAQRLAEVFEHLRSDPTRGLAWTAPIAPSHIVSTQTALAQTEPP
jgi:ABC-type Na+ transport system ATPase subunit NatA